MCVFGDKMQQAKEMPLKTLMTNSENTSSTSSFKMVGSRKNQGYAMHHKSFGVENEKHKAQLALCDKLLEANASFMPMRMLQCL